MKKTEKKIVTDMNTIFLVTEITKDDFLANGFAVNELNGVLAYNDHGAQAVWNKGEKGEYLYAIEFEENVIKAIYDVFDPLMLDGNGVQKWVCAVDDEDMDSMAVSENLRIKDMAYGDVQYEQAEEE